MHSQVRSIARLLYTHNPFYLLSASLVLYGLQTAFRDTNALPQNAWLLASSLCGYTLLLALTAYLVVRFGKVWEDARSLALLVIFLFVAISISFDEICSTSPSTAATVLLLGLVFALCVTECLIRSLRIKFPLGYRLPFYLMLALFFLYPLWVSPYLTNQLDDAIAWRVFLFPVFAGLITLTLVPAVRRGNALVRKNGTPWEWPWYPWPIFAFLAVGVCGRSFVLTFTAQAAMEWPASAAVQPSTDWASSFGLYYLTPFCFAILFLLAEIAIVERIAKLGRGVMLAVPLVILTAIPVGSGKPFVDFLADVVMRVGSPAWLAMIGAAAFYGYLWHRGVKAAEVGICASLLTLTMVGPGTTGLDTLALAQWWPLALLAAWQVERTLHTGSSIRCLAAVAALLLAACVAWPGTWFTAYYGFVPLHIFGAACLAISAVFADRFARTLRRLSAIIPVALALTALVAAPSLGVPGSFAVTYIASLAVATIVFWFVTGRRLWQIAMIANTAAAIISAAIWLHSGLHTTIPVRALTALTWGVICFFIAALISSLKGGLARHTRIWWKHERDALLREWKEDST
jgi:hypothetical protein